MTSKVRFVPRVLAEMLLPRDFDRETEPDIVMERPEQVEDYAQAGSSGGGMFAVHLFHAACMSQTIQGAHKVLDLACGPATQLLLTARLHPDIHFIGVDLSVPMLEIAERQRRDLGLTNVEFQQADITDLRQFKGKGVEAITSTLALHHLPTFDHLRRCAEQVRSLKQENTRIYLADLLRLKRSRTVRFMADMSADIQGPVFNDDFRNSMWAAFKKSDFDTIVREYLPGCDIVRMFPLALFVIIRTPPKPLSNAIKAQLVEIRSAQPARVIRDLDEIRMFFRLGGLTPDPFAR